MNLLICFLGMPSPTKVVLVRLGLDLDVRASGRLRSIREQNWTVLRISVGRYYL